MRTENEIYFMRFIIQRNGLRANAQQPKGDRGTECKRKAKRKQQQQQITNEKVDEAILHSYTLGVCIIIYVSPNFPSKKYPRMIVSFLRFCSSEYTNHFGK